jgi:hypothetical protein
MRPQKHRDATRDPRTYRDLLTLGRPSAGTCVSCHESVWYADWYRDGEPKMFSLGTRANICRQCCERKGDEVLGQVLRAERKARRYAKQLAASPDPQRAAPNVEFYARLAGVSVEYMRAALTLAMGLTQSAS